MCWTGKQQCGDQHKTAFVTSLDQREQQHVNTKAHFILSGLDASQEFPSRGYFSGEDPMTRRFGTGMRRMQPLPVIIFPTHPPTVRSFSPFQGFHRSSEAAGKGRHASLQLCWWGPLRGAAKATDVKLWPSAGFPVVCWENPKVNETVLQGESRGNGLFLSNLQKDYHDIPVSIQSKLAVIKFGYTICPVS